MEWVRRKLVRFLSKSRLISAYWFLQGLPPISRSKIAFELILSRFSTATVRLLRHITEQQKKTLVRVLSLWQYCRI